MRGTRCASGTKCSLMAHSAALDQMTNLFGEILGMVAGAFEGLSHEEDFETQSDITGFPAHLSGVDTGAQGIHLAVKTVSGERRLHVSLRVSFVYEREHLLEDLAHVVEIGTILRGNLVAIGSRAPDDGEYKISYALEIEHELQAG